MESFFDKFNSIEPNQGGIIIYRKNGEMEFTEELRENLTLIDGKKIEDLLYSYCKEKITQFSTTNGNKDVYAFVLYLDTHYGDVILYMNTHEELNKVLNKKEQTERDKQVMKYYGIGDFAYMIHEELPETLNKIMTLYLRIYDGQGTPSFDSDVAITNDIFYKNLISIGERVVNRLKPFSELKKATDFIGYVADHDKEYFDNTVDEEYYKRYVKLD
ncbi:DUF4303 domain-containing protein [Paenibacillus sp. KN14-4R]|uniref:DUF4303 domain-containing protein n=1 Tax=Paenibacillus sp. KN14-4R TaxID=3445773 RepID=UPI003F9F1D7F